MTEKIIVNLSKAITTIYQEPSDDLSQPPTNLSEALQIAYPDLTPKDIVRIVHAHQVCSFGQQFEQLLTQSSQLETFQQPQLEDENDKVNRLARKLTSFNSRKLHRVTIDALLHISAEPDENRRLDLVDEWNQIIDHYYEIMPATESIAPGRYQPPRLDRNDFRRQQAVKTRHQPSL